MNRYSKGLDVTLIVATAILLLACSLVLAAPTAPKNRPAFKSLRYEEDWSALRDPALRTEPLDLLKYISLGGNSFLTIGGEFRPQYELIQNEGWGTAPEDDNGHYLQRAMLHADFHLNQNLRTFAQLKSGLEQGRKGGPRPPDKDQLDLHQAFVDIKFAQWNSIVIRGGRQELSFGSQRLISTREGPNVRQSFDGLRLTVLEKDWNLSAFVSRPAETNPGIFDDSWDGQQALWGVYGVRPWSLLPWQGQIDLYYLGLNRRDAEFNQGTGFEKRHTIGARIWTPRKTVDYNFEFVYQFGNFAESGGIQAWTIASDTGFTIQNVRFTPRIGLKADVTSGDDEPQDPDLQTFNPLFPRGSYFGQLSPIGPQNHVDLHPSIELNLSRIFLSLEWAFFWRQNIHDGLYSVAGNLTRSGNLSRARFVGQQPMVQIGWSLDTQTSVTFHLARFLTGRFFKETPPSEDINFVAAFTTYKF